MACMDGCPGCKGWKSAWQSLCNECNGANSRASYDERTSTLASNLAAAALEELRTRYILTRVRDMRPPRVWRA